MSYRSKMGSECEAVCRAEAVAGMIYEGDAAGWTRISVCDNDILIDAMS